VRDEAFPSPFASLGAQDAIIAASLARVQVGEAKSTSNPEIGVAEGGPDLQWVFSRMPLDDPTALPTGTETSYAVPWPEDTAILTDLEQNYKALGWDFLLGANDFRGINQELNRNSSLDGFKSVVVGVQKRGGWGLAVKHRTPYICLLDSQANPGHHRYGLSSRSVAIDRTQANILDLLRIVTGFLHRKFKITPLAPFPLA